MRKRFLGAAAALVMAVICPQAKASLILFTANLTGNQEVPPTGSPGTGTGSVLLDTVAMTITVNESWSGLTAPATVSHIHQPAPPGSNAPVVFPFTGVPNGTSGSIPQQVFAITSAQITDMEAGLAYMNVHTANFPGGEIRGQLVTAAATPEPAAFLLLGSGLGALLCLRRRRA
jgi:CHRD domain